MIEEVNKYISDKNNLSNVYYIKPDKTLLYPVYSKSLLLSVISFFINIFNLVLPLFLFFVLDIFFKTKNYRILNIMLFASLLIILFNYLLYNYRRMIVIKLKNIIDNQIFNRLMDILFSIPNATIEMRREGFWLSLFNDIDIMKSSIRTEFFTKNIDIAYIILVTGFIIGLSPYTAVIILPIVFLYLLITFIFYKKVFSISAKENIAIATRNNLIISSIKNLSSVKSVLLKDKIKSSWRDYQSNLDYKLLYKEAVIYRFNNIINFLSIFCMLGLIYVLGCDVVSNKLDISVFVFTIFAMMLSFSLVNKIISGYPNYLRFSRSTNRLMTLSSQISQTKNGIEMKYPVSSVLKTQSIFISDGRGNTIINNLDMELHPGTLYIIKGKNSSIPSIILKSFAGIYPVENGNIMISEYNLKNVSTKTITNYVRYLGSEPIIFYGSIKENMICFSDSIKKHPTLELEKLLSIFNMDLIIENLPQGYNTIIDNNVDILSHEEVKLINIIRVLTGDPSVILLDDPFSMLSNENRKKLIDLLVSISKDRLVIITSSNYDSYVSDSHIIFIKNGEIEITENELVINNQKRRSLFKRISIH